MHAARRLTFAIGSAIFLLLMGLVYFGYQSFQREAEALQLAGQEDISWLTSQLELELMRFRDELQILRAEGRLPGTSAAQMNNRFDILWSRVTIFQRGRVGERLQTYDAESRVVARLLATMQAFETQIVTLQPTDVATIDAIAAAFDPFSDEMKEFSRKVIQGEQRVSAEIRAMLRSEAERTFQILALAVVMLLFALGNMWREARRYSRLAKRNERLAEEANRASRAKSAFLTMMSHELRTPMNGVLGLLALGRQATTDSGLGATLEKAERSARRMIGLLADILDFSALQSRTLAVQAVPFNPHGLANRLRGAANAAGMPLPVAVQDDMPEHLVGDETRLCQALVHLCTYLQETAGVRDVGLRLTYGLGQLSCVIAYGYEAGDTWYPALLDAEHSADADNFATGAVGPTIAREMIAQMQGQISILPDEGEGGYVIVALPLEAQSQRKIVLTLDCRTSVTRKLCEVAARDARITVLDTDAKGRPDAVIHEWAPDESPVKLATIRAENPQARIVCLGADADESLCDQRLSLPADIATLRRAILGIAADAQAA